MAKAREERSFSLKITDFVTPIKVRAPKLQAIMNPISFIFQLQSGDMPNLITDKLLR